MVGGHGDSDGRCEYLRPDCYWHLGVGKDFFCLADTPKQIPKEINAQPLEWVTEGLRFFKIDLHDDNLHFLAVGDMLIDGVFLEFGKPISYEEPCGNDARDAIGRPPFVLKCPKSTSQNITHKKFMEEITKAALADIVEAGWDLYDSEEILSNELKKMDVMDHELQMLDIRPRKYCDKHEETAILSIYQYSWMQRMCSMGTCPHCGVQELAEGYDEIVFRYDYSSAQVSL